MTVVNVQNMKWAVAAVSLVALATASSVAHAVIKAMDSASAPAYAAEAEGAWKGQYPGDDQYDQAPPGNDDGGSGFGIWSFSGGYHLENLPIGRLNHFIDGVDFPTTVYNNLGAPAFGLGNSGLPFAFQTTVATRPFDAPLAVGDVFSADIDTPAEYDDFTGSSFPFVIITFRDATGASTYGMSAGDSIGFGPYNWNYSDANHLDTPESPAGDYGTDAGVGPIAPTAPSDGSSIRLEVTSATTGRVTFDSVPLNITFAAGLPSSVTFTLFDNFLEDDGTGNPTGEHAFFFDNLMIESAGTPGDYNNDTVVNAADYTVWRDNLGTNNTLPNDSIGGTIDVDQYNQWKGNFGGGAGAVGGGAVPEPATWLIVLSGALGGSRLRGCRQTIES